LGLTCGGNNVCGASLNPVADAYVRSGQYANTNFGGDASLQVKRQDNDVDNNRRTFLRFDISSLTTISSAKLRLYGNRPTGSSPAAAYAVMDNGWIESGATGITWNNKPGTLDQQDGNVTIGTTLKYYEFDVKAWVSNQKATGASTITLGVLPKEDNAASPSSFESREGTTGHPPELFVIP
jgi:hypothetical protein